MGDRVGDTVVPLSLQEGSALATGTHFGGAYSAVRSPAWGDISLALNGWSKEVDWKSECVRKGSAGGQG